MSQRWKQLCKFRLLYFYILLRTFKTKNKLLDFISLAMFKSQQVQWYESQMEVVMFWLHWDNLLHNLVFFVMLCYSWKFLRIFTKKSIYNRFSVSVCVCTACDFTYKLPIAALLHSSYHSVRKSSLSSTSSSPSSVIFTHQSPCTPLCFQTVDCALQSHVSLFGLSWS